MKRDVWTGLIVVPLSLAVVVAYAANRMVNNCLWVDELYMLLVARMDVLPSMTQTLDYSAPLYQLLLKPFVHAGLTSELSLRLPSLVSALAGIFYVWLLALRNFGRWVAAGSVLLTAVNPFFLYYAAEARPYMLFFFVSCASFHHYLRCMDGERSWHGWLYAVFTCAMILSHYYGYLLLAAQGLHYLLAGVQDGPRPAWFGKYFWSTALAAVLLLALPLNYLREGAPAAGWMGRPTLYSWYFGDIFSGGRIGAVAAAALLFAVYAVIRRASGAEMVPEQALAQNAGPQGAGLRDDGPGSTGPASAGLGGAGPGNAGSGSPGTRRAEPETSGPERARPGSTGVDPLPVLILWAVFGLYPVLAVSTWLTPLYTPRHFVFLVAPLCILVAYLLSRMPKVVFIAGLGVMLYTLSLRSVSEAREYRRDFQDVVRFLNADADVPCRVPYSPYGNAYRSAVDAGLTYYGLSEGVARSQHDVTGQEYSFLRGPCNAVVFSQPGAYTKWLDGEGIPYRVLKFGNMFIVKVEG